MAELAYYKCSSLFAAALSQNRWIVAGSLRTWKMHFWDPSQWDKMCFEYQRIKQWKKGSTFSHLLTVWAGGADPSPLAVGLTVKCPVFMPSLKFRCRKGILRKNTSWDSSQLCAENTWEGTTNIAVIVSVWPQFNPCCIASANPPIQEKHCQRHNRPTDWVLNFYRKGLAKHQLQNN